MFVQWEPGFDGGFQQQFVTRVKEVKTGKVTTQRSEHSRMDRDSEFVTQDIIIQPNVEYAFSVKAVNVQGDSDFSEEKLKALKGSLSKSSIKQIFVQFYVPTMHLSSPPPNFNAKRDEMEQNLFKGWSIENKPILSDKTLDQVVVLVLLCAGALFIEFKVAFS